MCFNEKMNCIWIRKRENRVLDPVRTPGRVGSGIRARAPDRKCLFKRHFHFFQIFRKHLFKRHIINC